MALKCNGVKILDLEGKDKFTGNEYVVVAEKDENYKIPMEQIGDVIINGSKFKAAIEKVYTSSTPTAAVTLADSEFKFSFGIPPGERGDNGYNGTNGKDGKDGKDGIDGVPGIDGDTVRTILAYKSTSTTVRPATPVGGSWDAVTNVVTYPEGWTGNDANPNGYVWMSSASFSSNGTQMSPWTTPLRLTGDSGKDGVDGTNIEFIYKLTISSLVIPTKPTGNSQLEAIDNWGWTDHPTGISEEFQCEWVCSHSLQEDGTWGEWQGPTIWSRWGTNGKDGDGVEYIFQRTTLPAPPHNITDNNPDQDEYIPASYPGEERWTDDPSGVNETYKYEWVSQRKYKGNTHKWGNFSTPSLWAKYGDNGQDGISLRVMYTKTSGSDVQPRDPDRLNINPGSIWGVGMPKVTGKEAIWGIQALVSYDNELFIDETLPEDERGWQGPYLITGIPGLDGNNFNYQVDAFKESTTEPERPTGNDPYNPGDGWTELPASNGGTWWRSTALVQGETGVVIEWGPPIKVSGQGIVIKGTLDSTDDLPMTGNSVGDAYVIDGFLWVWNGEEWVNVGTVQGTDGNYYEYRFARNNSWATAPSLVKDTRYPSGWSSSAPVASSGKVLWATFALISGVDNSLMTDWAEPYYMTGMTGDQGGSGIPGVGYEVRYCKGTETTYTGETWSDSMKSKRDPTGWSIDVPTLVNGDEYNYIWFILVRVIDDQLETDCYWSKPNPMGGIITPDPVSKNPIMYPAGVFSPSTTYINDGETAPYVWDSSDGEYYFLKLITGPSGWISSNHNNVTPATDGGASWTKFEHYEALYAAIGVFGNALVGGAVFNNNLMFSLRGKTASDADTSMYLDIDASSSINAMNPSNSFRPNFLLDFENGEAWFGAGGIHLAADPESSSIELQTTDSKLTLDLLGLSIVKPVPSGSYSTIGTYVNKNNISLLTGDYQFSLNSNGLYMGKALIEMGLDNGWFKIDKDGNAFIKSGLVIGAVDLASGPRVVYLPGGAMVGMGGDADNTTFNLLYGSNGGHLKLLNTNTTKGCSIDVSAIEKVSNSDLDPGITIEYPSGEHIKIWLHGILCFYDSNNAFIIYRGSAQVHRNGITSSGYTGTINGARFIGGICVGTA